MKKKIFRGYTKPVCIMMSLVLCYTVAYYAVNSIEMTVPTSLTYPDEELYIVLDAGHGGMDGGCSTSDGVPEKGINLNIAKEVKELLELQGYNVVLTRETDTSIHDKGVEGIRSQKESDMKNRLDIFNEHNNAICISIHQNNFTDPYYSGAQMFYSENNPESETLARIMQENFVRNIQPDNSREIKLCGKELYLCYFSENPTVMVECGFLSNPDEAEKLKNPMYQKEVAFTIFSGINEFIEKRG